MRPPINALIAAVHGYKPKEAQDEEIVGGEALAAMFGEGPVRMPGDG